MARSREAQDAVFRRWPTLVYPRFHTCGGVLLLGSCTKQEVTTRMQRVRGGVLLGGGVRFLQYGPESTPNIDNSRAVVVTLNHVR